MTDSKIYADIAERTNGAFMLGVVGPVRTGKSTFIKRFMETMVIPNIENEYERERAKDELPQSGSGRTIMTTEPKFVPENAVTVDVSENVSLTVRLVDCVGYMVDGATGQSENGEDRLVATPWYDHEITLTKAAEEGTRKVIHDHSTIGIVVTTDGSFGDIPREKYIEPENRVISELKKLGKPFVVIVNTDDINSAEAQKAKDDIEKYHGVNCICVNCAELNETDIQNIIHKALEAFPIQAIGIFLPEWMEALSDDYSIKANVLNEIFTLADTVESVRDAEGFSCLLGECEDISSAAISASSLNVGEVSISIAIPKSLYYNAISEQTGLSITNDGDIINMLCEISAVQDDYNRIKKALEDVRTKGYGVVMPAVKEIRLEEPQIVRQNGKYTVKLKASAPAIHMMKTTVETEVTPAIGGSSASEDIISFLLQGFEGDINRIWESNIFGKPLNNIAEEGLYSKLESMPENTTNKLKYTLQRVVNEGGGTLICILL